jgi:hypothetical protein
VAPNADSDDERAQNRTVGQNSAREELERLLDEPITDHEDVETMSLHSNVGRRTGKSRKKKPSTTRKSVRVFGIDLFGRRPALPGEEDDQNHDEYARRPRTRPRAISTSNLDEDAAPLDDATLDFRTRALERWAPPQTDEELAAEEAREQQRAEKELRKAQRRQRKDLKRLAESGAFNDAEGQEFEGFPGSGGGFVDPPEGFGPFVGVASSSKTDNAANGHTRVSSDDEDDKDVEFGAVEYMKKRRVAGGDGSRSGSGSHSRSRSRTSASISADGSQPHPRSAMSTSSSQGAKLQTPTRPRHKTAKGVTSSNDRRSKSSITSSSATQSLPSPTLPPSSDVKINTHDFEGKQYFHQC